MKVRLKPAAKADVAGIYGWYHREVGKDVAQRFRRSFRKCGRTIGLHPLAFPKVHGEIRRALLHNFPYAVFFKVEKNEVVVFGCFHGHRDPTVWQNQRHDQ